MTAPLRRILPAADLDIDRNVQFFSKKEARLGVAFFQAVRLSIDDLAQMPGMGSPVILPRLSDAGIRKWPVIGFPDILIFYREAPSGIEVIRVLGARQNWHSVLK